MAAKKLVAKKTSEMTIIKSTSSRDLLLLAAPLTMRTAQQPLVFFSPFPSICIAEDFQGSSTMVLVSSIFGVKIAQCCKIRC
ncbi:MAG: hypothetical protein C4292_06985 [Nitrososphaera sp.]